MTFLKYDLSFISTVYYGVAPRDESSFLIDIRVHKINKTKTLHLGNNSRFTC